MDAATSAELGRCGEANGGALAILIERATAPPHRKTAAASIECERVGVRFADGTEALGGVDLHVPAGGIVSLVGPSGCGKTTLLRCLAGLTEPTSGRVRREPPGAADSAGQLAYVFQSPALLPWRSALQNVALPLELTGRWRGAAERRELVLRQLAAVGLGAADAGKLPAELSGGMRMRVSLARALVTDPSILLLDEPFAALDDMLRTRLGELVLGLWDERPRTIVLVTHNIGEAVLMSHHVAVMGRGTVEATLEIPLPWPRSAELRRSAEFAAVYGEVSDRLAEAVR